MKKKVLIIAIAAAVLAIAVVSAIVVVPMMSGEVLNENVAYVTKISDMNSVDFAFSGNRYSGVVEMGEVVSVKADSDKIIKETFVKAGDTVNKGDKLFEYDVEQMKLQLSQSQLDLEQAKTEITNLNNQITSLESEKSKADQNGKLNIDNQILEKKLKIKRAEFTVTTNEEQIRELNNSIENSIVKSEVDGKVQKVASPDVEGYSAVNSYITIATTDDYKVKANISEENIDAFSEGTPIIIRSRKDESVTWTGKVTSVDTSLPESNANEMYSEDVANNSDSKYPVYVDIDGAEGLMAGQHVTIEIDTTQVETSDKLSIDEFFICDADTNPYVWCKSANGTLEKRSVELGEYDENALSYEIVGGLSSDDCIAFPEERFTEGMPTMDVSTFASAEFEDEAAEVM
ncbi:MAG: biotin/lipoyl-binding protein [Ruminococcus sp.]|nr:biotin/lipoyl-binding protein [Ruminococcus sp.]